MTEVELLEGLRKGRKHFYRICVEQGNFASLDLSGVSFEECLLAVEFTGAILNNAQFINSNLKTCLFSKCSLVNAVFIGNSLDGADFSGAQIQGITFKNNTYHSSEVTETNLQEMIHSGEC